MTHISVIMPAHNAHTHIATAIASTLTALRGRGSITVFDDGSTDSTSNIVRSFSDQGVQLLQSPISRGSGFARRELVKTTRGPYVANMDADDYCFPWRFDVQLQLIKKADFTFSSAVSFQDNHPMRARPSQPLALRPSTSRTELLLGNPFPHSSFMGTRESLVAIGNYSTIRRGQDYELWLRAVKNGVRITKTAIPTIAYRRSQQQITSRATEYQRAVSVDPEVRNAFLQLLEQESPLRFASLEKIPNEQWDLITQMPWIKRQYYQRFWRRGQIFRPVSSPASEKSITPGRREEHT